MARLIADHPHRLAARLISLGSLRAPLFWRLHLQYERDSSRIAKPSLASMSRSLPASNLMRPDADLYFGYATLTCSFPFECNIIRQNATSKEQLVPRDLHNG